MLKFQITISRVDPDNQHIEPPTEFTTRTVTATTAVEACAKGANVIREFVFRSTS